MFFKCDNMNVFDVKNDEEEEEEEEDILTVLSGILVTLKMYFLTFRVTLEQV